jgi:tetratricopeptide (TPR) repeat protein
VTEPGDVTDGRVPAEPADLLVTVSTDQVRLTGPGLDVTAAHHGVRPGLAEAVREARSAFPAHAGTGPAAPQVMSLERVGRLLGESFLPGEVGAALGRALAAAERAHQPVRAGVAVPPGLAGLPWEALPCPDGSGPLALHPLVSLYRKTDAAPARVLPGPLRIVVAIAAPDSGGAPVLEYERELRNVLAAVRGARQDTADVRVVPFATPAAIRSELDRSPAHVLHISGHGSPGRLYLENQDGTARPVTADQLVDLAIPPGRMPPVITLAACYTDAVGPGGVSFAARLCQLGAGAVIGTETSVTDSYATRLLARVYGALAQQANPDVVATLAQARREVQAELESSVIPQDVMLAGLGEWAAVTVLAASGTVPVLGTSQPDSLADPASTVRPAITGLAGREDWYFVGRRAEQRHWPAELTGPATAGIVICGIGGTGKTTLAAELARRVHDREPSRILISLSGPLTLEGLLGQVVTVMRRELLVSDQDTAKTIQALDAAAQTDHRWQDRLAVLREHVLDHVPVLLLLDNFEDNLDRIGTVHDEVLGELLGGWVADPGLSRLLVTSRYPFSLPGGAAEQLSFRHIGALSLAETMKLAWSLPALDQLGPAELGRVWRLAGGHPRSLEYLDALLSGGQARYPDVTARLAAAISRRLDGTDRDAWLAARTSLDAALAETVTLAAGDVLLGDLLADLDDVPGAAELLLGISVYREPVDANAVRFQAHPQADRPDADLGRQLGICQAASLVTIEAAVDGQQRFSVHRWTAAELAARADPALLRRAHVQAAGYRRSRTTGSQSETADVHDLLEARYHLLEAGQPEDAAQVSQRVVALLNIWGARDQEAALIHDTLRLLPADSPHRAGWLHHGGMLAYARGDYDEAVRLYQQSIEIKEQFGDWAGAARSYGNLGVIAQSRGDHDEAARQYQRSLEIWERLGDEAGMADSSHNLGTLAYEGGDLNEAARQYQRSLDAHERLGDQKGMASGYHDLAILAQHRGDYDEAARQYHRSLTIKEQLGDLEGMASDYNQLGMLAQDRGDYREAVRQYRRFLEIEERTGGLDGMARGYTNLGSIAHDLDDLEEAARQYQRGLDISDQIGDQAGVADGYHNLGIVAHDRGDYDEAARLYQRSLDLKVRLGDQAGLVGSYYQLGVLAHEQGNFEEAARQYQRSLDIAERLGEQARMAIIYRALSRLETERGGSAAGADAIALLARALVIRLRIDVPEAIGDLRSLAAWRRILGVAEFTRLLTAADPDLADTITPRLDQLDENDSTS